MKSIVCTIISFITSILSFIFGNVDFIFKCLLVLMTLDYITGMIKAYINKNIDSRVGIKGIFKKFGYLIMISVCFILDKILNTNDIVRNLMIYYLMFNEMISIIENWALMGIRVPKFITNSLNELKSDLDFENISEKSKKNKKL